MSEQLPLSIGAAVFEDGQHYFVALTSPLAKTSEGYYQLRRMAKIVLYPDGSQVFVCERTKFGDAAEEQNDKVVDFTYGAVKAEGIMPDIAIHPLSELKEISNGQTD